MDLDQRSEADGHRLSLPRETTLQAQNIQKYFEKITRIRKEKRIRKTSNVPAVYLSCTRIMSRMCTVRPETKEIYMTAEC